MDQLLLDVGLDANAAVAAITKVLKVGLVTDAAAIMTAELLWNLTHRVLLDVELDAAGTADVMSELLETQGWWMAAAPCRRKWSSSSTTVPTEHESTPAPTTIMPEVKSTFAPASTPLTAYSHDALTITEDAPEAQTPAPTVMPEDE
ncbi:hypothetical protein PF006_g30582 [Phytophthora fragariae]|uniref:Uncharacterized protein n=1 Tax=Phytophthora fragariae TaxID=53985 RepID=A0A6A3PY22_9STRA|nr:hypothetical protein PF006_g30582 [Phytophthora fragariae]